MKLTTKLNIIRAVLSILGAGAFGYVVRLLTLILVVVGISVPASAQSTSTARKTIIFTTAAHAADVVSTATVPNWTQHEVNPLIPRSTAGLIAAKGAVAATTGLITWKLAKNHPKAAFWLNIGIGSGISMVAIHNTRVNAALRGR